jgi:hypothetical protein
VIASDPDRALVQLGEICVGTSVFEFPDRRDLGDGDVVEDAE